jgi:uncharacterized membrane protein
LADPHAADRVTIETRTVATSTTPTIDRLQFPVTDPLHVTVEGAYSAFAHLSGLPRGRIAEGEDLMIILGVILLIVGLLVAELSILTWIGIVLIVVGLILNLLPIGGSTRRVY